MAYPDDETVFSRLWDMVCDKIGWLAPTLIVSREDTLTITDYRPTFLMALAMIGFLFFAATFIFLQFKVGPTYDSFGLWSLLILALVSLFFIFRGTIWEIYFFDKKADSYIFVRQFIYRKELVEGAMSQFTGAYVKTEVNDDSESYFVVLKQEAMFLAGVSEQALRGNVPIFNWFEREADIANAISEFLASSRRSNAPPSP